MIENILQYIASFLFVLALIGATAWVLKKFLSSGHVPGMGLLKNKNSRVKVLEMSIVDTHRRLVLIRRDDVEHLLMTGGPNDLVIETDIQRPENLESDNKPDQAKETDRQDR